MVWPLGRLEIVARRCDGLADASFPVPSSTPILIAFELVDFLAVRINATTKYREIKTSRDTKTRLPSNLGCKKTIFAARDFCDLFPLIARVS